MAYRLRYTANFDWIGPGMGPMGGALTPLTGAVGGSGNSQTLQLDNAVGGQNINGSGTGGIIQSADLTTLTNAMAADILAQALVAATLAKLQGFASGQN